jgi:folylpolyglutamate synthase/dihydropteroate synthase
LIIDGSHNPQGFESLLEAIRFYLPDRPIFWLCSLQNNRPIEPLLQTVLQVPGTQSVIWSRAVDGAERYHLPSDAVNQIDGRVACEAIDHLPQAFAELRRQLAKYPEAYGIVSGSLYTAGDTLALLLATS